MILPVLALALGIGLYFAKKGSQPSKDSQGSQVVANPSGSGSAPSGEKTTTDSQTSAVNPASGSSSVVAGAQGNNSQSASNQNTAAHGNNVSATGTTAAIALPSSGGKAGLPVGNSPLAGLPAGPGAITPSGATGSGELARKDAPQVPAGPECVTVTYRRKERAPASLTQKNLIHLKHTGLNPASVCVRVDNVPMAFDRVPGKQDEILVGPIGRKKNEIVVRYCMGKATCKEDCTIPKAKKDEFMEAIGAGESDVANAKAAQWDADEAGNQDAEVHAALDADLKRAMENPEERMADPLDPKNANPDWSSISEAPACKNAGRREG